MSRLGVKDVDRRRQYLADVAYWQREEEQAKEVETRNPPPGDLIDDERRKNWQRLYCQICGQLIEGRFTHLKNCPMVKKDAEKRRNQCTS